MFRNRSPRCIQLDLSANSVQDRLRSKMRRLTLTTLTVLLAALCTCAIAHAQTPQDTDAKVHTGKSDPVSRVTIEVSGGEKNSPIENASVYLKYVEERKIKKDKKVELNVKTNREGTAHIPEA